MKRALLIGIAAGAAVLLVGGAVVWWLAARSPSAEEIAAQYLDALSDGDFAAIAQLRAEPLDADAEAILEDAFAGASAYPQSPEIEEVTTHDGTATVEATVELAGERHPIEFELTTSNGRWKLAGDHLGALEVTTTLGDSVWVGDALAPVEAPILLLPAVYPVQAAPRGLVHGEATVTVTGTGEGGPPAQATVDATLTPEATAQAQARLDEYADACAEPASEVPTHCGLKVPWAADLATLSALAFRIDTRPTLALSPDATTFAGSGGVIVATATGTTRAGAQESFTYQADDWTLRGTVAFTGDEMVLAVD